MNAPLNESVFLFDACIAIVVWLMMFALCDHLIRRLPVYDVPLWRSWFLFFVGIVIWSIAKRVAEETSGQAVFDEPIGDYPISYSRLFVIAWLSFCAVMSIRALPVRVLVLRSFRAHTDKKLMIFFRRAAGYFGRVDALIRVGNMYRPDGWGLRGSTVGDRWKQAIPTLVKRAKLIVVDVSVSTPGLIEELKIIESFIGKPVVFFTAESVVPSVIRDLVPIRYSKYASLERKTISQVFDAMEIVTGVTGYRWRWHRARTLKRFASSTSGISDPCDTSRLPMGTTPGVVEKFRASYQSDFTVPISHTTLDDKTIDGQASNIGLTELADELTLRNAPDGLTDISHHPTGEVLDNSLFDQMATGEINWPEILDDTDDLLNDVYIQMHDQSLMSVRKE